MRNNEKNFLILYDDICVLCTWSVRFIIKNDPQKQFYFASLADENIDNFLPQNIEIDKKNPESIILIEGENIFRYSIAVLVIVKNLRFPVNLLSVFFVIPGPMRDYIYKLIAKHRYRIFGKLRQCWKPPQGEMNRFDYENYFQK